MQSGVNQNNLQVSVPAYLETVVRDADHEWSAWFISNGLSEPNVQYNIVQSGMTATSVCNPTPVTATFNNAFYCGGDSFTMNGATYKGQLVLPAVTFQKMWTGDIFQKKSKRAGDFGAAAVVAHEFGHHVADEIAKQLNVAPVKGKNNELLADCFAGNWTSSVYTRGYLENGDIDEGVEAIRAIGDFEYNNPGHHGTPTERVAALKSGFSGYPTQCINKYWTGFGKR